jgi:hypothetical protein
MNWFSIYTVFNTAEIAYKLISKIDSITSITNTYFR